MKKMLFFAVTAAIAAPFATNAAAGAPQQIAGLYSNLQTLVETTSELAEKAYRLEYNMDGDSTPNKRELAQAAFRNAKAQVGSVIKRLKDLGQSRDDIANRMKQPLSARPTAFYPKGQYDPFINILNEYY